MKFGKFIPMFSKITQNIRKEAKKIGKRNSGVFKEAVSSFLKGESPREIMQKTVESIKQNEVKNLKNIVTSKLENEKINEKSIEGFKPASLFEVPQSTIIQGTEYFSTHPNIEKLYRS